MDGAADIVVAALTTPLHFDAAAAGQRHSAAGEAVRAAVDRTVGQARDWARAVRETAEALRSAADRYEDDDAHAATVLR